MRGNEFKQMSCFSYISPEQRVPQDHPLRPIREMVNKYLKELSPVFDKLYSHTNVMCARSHSAGGVGSIMGSKNLKAIGVVGTGSFRIAGKKEDWEKLIKYQLSLLGSANQHGEQGDVVTLLSFWSFKKMKSALASPQNC